MRGRECRWRLVGETFGVDGGWWEEAPERVIESRARSLLYRPPYATPFPRTLPRSATHATDGSRYFTPVCEPRRVLAHSASFSPPRSSLSSALLLPFSLAHTFELRAYNVPLYIYLSVDCTKDDDDDNSDDDDEVETGAVEYRGRASQVCVSVPEIDGNELPALRTYSCEISVSRRMMRQINSNILNIAPRDQINIPNIFLLPK